MAISDHPLAIAEKPQAGAPALWAALRAGVSSMMPGGRPDSLRGRKLISLAIALALEALLLLLLLTIGTQFAGREDSTQAITTFKAVEFAAPPAPEPPAEAASASPATPPVTPPAPDQPQPQPQPAQPSPMVLTPRSQPQPQPEPPAEQAKPQPSPSPAPKIGVKIAPGRTYGPADTGNPRTAGDSKQVGTAPNGEPLYAARWYREPTDQELAGYLSTANGPGSALIACKTVADYYVEDCQLLGESPPGSQMGRAVMAAAWQFRVRPARIGGREQFGSWVRIRIDYTVRKAPR